MSGLKTPVFLASNLKTPVAYVSHRQSLAEIAGKALKSDRKLWRKAELRQTRKGDTFYVVSYFEPTAEQIKLWEARIPRDSSGMRTGWAYIVPDQTGVFAH